MRASFARSPANTAVSARCSRDGHRPTKSACSICSPSAALALEAPPARCCCGFSAGTDSRRRRTSSPACATRVSTSAKTSNPSAIWPRCRHSSTHGRPRRGFPTRISRESARCRSAKTTNRVVSPASRTPKAEASAFPRRAPEWRQPIGTLEHDNLEKANKCGPQRRLPSGLHDEQRGELYRAEGAGVLRAGFCERSRVDSVRGHAAELLETDFAVMDAINYPIIWIPPYLRSLHNVFVFKR